ncbi:hypothetical protein K9M41_02420 [Candidatus Gracilibacteria bacterium]|nr:hypothetical protein [Candidatus Gracilibacteria bacterium]
MKTLFMRPLTLFSVLVSSLAILAIIFSTFSFAEDVVDPGVIGPEDMEVLGAYPANVPNPDCVDNYESWPNSHEFNAEHIWSLDMIPSSNGTDHTVKQLIDLNGDGIPDFFYSYKKKGLFQDDQNFNYGNSCILIGTGKGWNLEYRCVMEYDRDEEQATYYGDCALIEE